MINRETIARMKDGVLIINTARGALIHSDDLAERCAVARWRPRWMFTTRSRPRLITR